MRYVSRIASSVIFVTPCFCEGPFSQSGPLVTPATREAGAPSQTKVTILKTGVTTVPT